MHPLQLPHPAPSIAGCDLIEPMAFVPQSLSAPFDDVLPVGVCAGCGTTDSDLASKRSDASIYVEKPDQTFAFNKAVNVSA